MFVLLVLVVIGWCPEVILVPAGHSVIGFAETHSLRSFVLPVLKQSGRKTVTKHHQVVFE
jgi:hypothetical protein